MGEGERDEDRSTLKGNSMTVLIRFKKGGHGTSFFYSIVGSKCRRYIIYMENCSVPIYRGQGRRGDL
jgi:hypothetical protein